MTEGEANELRLIANEVMRRLWDAGEKEQLHILSTYARSAIEALDRKASAGPPADLCAERES